MKRQNVPCLVEFDVHLGKDYIKIGIHKTSLLVSDKTECPCRVDFSVQLGKVNRKGWYLQDYFTS